MLDFTKLPCYYLTLKLDSNNFPVSLNTNNDIGKYSNKFYVSYNEIIPNTSETEKKLRFFGKDILIEKSALKLKEGVEIYQLNILFESLLVNKTFINFSLSRKLSIF